MSVERNPMMMGERGFCGSNDRCVRNRKGEGQASACPDEQTLVPPVPSRLTRIRSAFPGTGRSRVETFLLGVFVLSFVARASLPAAPAGVMPPGDAFEVPQTAGVEGAPLIFEHSREAGPDETLFAVGTHLTGEVVVWDTQPGHPQGGPVKAKTQMADSTYLAFTVSQSAYDGPMVAAVKNAAGTSAPFVINAPAPWWCSPAVAVPGKTVRVFGRNLACRPDCRRAYVWICAPGRIGRWAEVLEAGKYAVTFALPADLAADAYEVWLHGGRGGAWGWGGPVRLEVREVSRPARAKTLRPGKDGALALQAALDAMAARGGGTVKLPAGTFAFAGTLRIPANVTLCGAGREQTTLSLQSSPETAFARFNASGWGVVPEAIHSPGDTMTYALDVPKAGRWTVWLRYATDMSPWKMSGVSGNMIVQLDGGAEQALENLPNTGGFGSFRWTRSAALDLPAGHHVLRWRNIKGGGLSLDAFVLTLGAGDVPSDNPWPVCSSERIVIQAEACATFESKQGHLPGTDRAAVWLAGDGAALADLTVLGNAQVNQGIAIRSPNALEWVQGCDVRRVRLADCEGKRSENCGVFAHNLRGGTVSACELWGRAPLFLSGVRQCVFSDNRLVSVTRFGGNAEAAILGRCEPIEECVIEGNAVVSPPGAEAGGPTARRLIWLSTGHGSVVHNWIANNGAGTEEVAGQAQFGGVAGTDQNVGEMILFEGNHRTMYFGPLAGAAAQSVDLPSTLPDTPEERLGSVKRGQLAHDAEGRETPAWPPTLDDGTDEPPLGEFFVTVFAGPGQGQTRRVVGREGTRLLLDRPWRAVPAAGAVVAVGTMFYQNLIVGNRTPDGMSGVQLWISCVENVVAANTVARQRKQGLFFYANGTTLASSMPRTWNRGISPLFWNLAEGNRTDECSDGAQISSGDSPSLPVEFPRALGNVLRHNSFVRSRFNGVGVSSGRNNAADRSASVVGTVAEFNLVRDAPLGYHASANSDVTVFRRDHAYFWDRGIATPTAFQVDAPSARVAFEENTVEGPTGVGERSIREVKKSWEK